MLRPIVHFFWATTSSFETLQRSSRSSERFNHTFAPFDRRHHFSIVCRYPYRSCESSNHHLALFDRRRRFLRVCRYYCQSGMLLRMSSWRHKLVSQTGLFLLVYPVSTWTVLCTFCHLIVVSSHFEIISSSGSQSQSGLSLCPYCHFMVASFYCNITVPLLAQWRCPSRASSHYRFSLTP